MSGFKPSLFISAGETNAVYTLKVKRLHSFYIGFKKQFEVRSEHVCTLSTDPDVAYSKALVYARHHDISLETKRSELKKLRDIDRSNSTKNTGEQRHHPVRLKSEELTHQEKISRGIFPVGKYAGKHFHEAPPDYIGWLIDKIPDLEDGLIKDMALAVMATCGHFRLPTPDKFKHLGSIGDSVDLPVIVVDSRVIGPKSNRSKYQFKMLLLVTEDNTMLIVRTNRIDPKPGDKLRVTGKVKTHSDYKGQSQTELEVVTLQ